MDVLPAHHRLNQVAFIAFLLLLFTSTFFIWIRFRKTNASFEEILGSKIQTLWISALASNSDASNGLDPKFRSLESKLWIPNISLLKFTVQMVRSCLESSGLVVTWCWKLSSGAIKLPLGRQADVQIVRLSTIRYQVYFRSFSLQNFLLFSLQLSLHKFCMFVLIFPSSRGSCKPIARMRLGSKVVRASCAL